MNKEERARKKLEVKRLWEAGVGPREAARQTGLARSTVHRWMQGWEATEPPETLLEPALAEEERLRRIARSGEVPDTVYLYSEEEREEYLRLLELAGGDHGRIARRKSGGPFILLAEPPPPLICAKEAYRYVFGPGSREERRARLRRLKVRRMAEYLGASHPPGYLGE